MTNGTVHQTMQPAKRALYLGIVVVIGVGLGVLFWWIVSGGVSDSRSGAKGRALHAGLPDWGQSLMLAATQVAPQPWLGSSDDFKQPPLVFSIQQLESAPLLVYQSSDSPSPVSFELMPRAEGLLLSWEVKRLEHQTLLIGSGDWYDQPILMVWTFSDGNPQVHFRFGMNLESLYAGEGSESALPTANTRDDSSLPNQLELQWDLGREGDGGFDRANSVESFHVLGVAGHVSNSDASSEEVAMAENRLLLNLAWRLDEGAQLVACEGMEFWTGGFSLTLSRQNSVDPGETSPWWESVTLASSEARVPLFFFPSGSQAPRNTVAKTTEEVIAQIRTLLYGHSNPSDPRYGTTGLIAANLSGVFVVPPEVSLDGVKKAIDLPERVEVLASAPWKDLSTEVILQPGRSCSSTVRFRYEPKVSSLFKATSVSPSALLRPLEIPLAGSIGYESFAKHYFGFFSGNSTRLREQAETVSTRVELLGIPFLASRNPLVDASRQSLITPDRQGEWRISDNLARDLQRYVEEQTTVDSKLNGQIQLLGTVLRRANQRRIYRIWYRPQGVEIQKYVVNNEIDANTKTLEIVSHVSHKTGRMSSVTSNLSTGSQKDHYILNMSSASEKEVLKWEGDLPTDWPQPVIWRLKWQEKK